MRGRAPRSLVVAARAQRGDGHGGQRCKGPERGQHCTGHSPPKPSTPAPIPRDFGNRGVCAASDGLLQVHFMLGLLTPTDDRWIETALAHFDEVLLDHLHCELKAASNATALVARYPQHTRLVRELSALAQEELSHVVEVHAQLAERGVRPRPPDRDRYAIALRRATASAGGPGDALVDRLSIAALIEARSCERFSILRERAPTEALRGWYSSLFASEARHHRIFSSLAEDIAGVDAARDRLAWLAAREAEIIAELPITSRVH